VKGWRQQQKLAATLWWVAFALLLFCALGWLDIDTGLPRAY